jgi:hypothetical protein
VAEGGGLLNRYTVNSRIEGSNPSVSAILLRAARFASPLDGSRNPGVVLTAGAISVQ